jgi:hypothetical protein
VRDLENHSRSLGLDKNEIPMAGRKAGFRHNEDTRAKIQAAALINRLTDHVMADAPIMDASQVNAAKTLLNKVLPDLASVQHSGDADNPVQLVHRLERVVVRPTD